MDVEVVCFSLTQEGMKYKMPLVSTHGTGWEYSPEHTVWRGHCQEVQKGINSFSGIEVPERDCPR
jgi:hypothetical protein